MIEYFELGLINLCRGPKEGKRLSAVAPNATSFQQYAKLTLPS